MKNEHNWLKNRHNSLANNNLHAFIQGKKIKMIKKNDSRIPRDYAESYTVFTLVH